MHVPTMFLPAMLEQHDRLVKNVHFFTSLFKRWKMFHFLSVEDCKKSLAKHGLLPVFFVPSEA